MKAMFKIAKHCTRSDLLVSERSGRYVVYALRASLSALPFAVASRLYL